MTAPLEVRVQIGPTVVRQWVEVGEVARTLGISTQVVYNTLHRYKALFDPPTYRKVRHRTTRLLTPKDVAVFRTRYAEGRRRG